MTAEAALLLFEGEPLSFLVRTDDRQVSESAVKIELRIKGGSILVDPDTRGHLCHVCESDLDVQFIRINNSKHQREKNPRGTGQVYLRLCVSCIMQFVGAVKEGGP